MCSGVEVLDLIAGYGCSAASIPPNRAHYAKQTWIYSGAQNITVLYYLGEKIIRSELAICEIL